MPTSFEWAVAALLPLMLTALSRGLLAGAEPPRLLGLWILYMLLDAAYGHLFHAMLLAPARRIASRLPGSKVPPLRDEKGLSEQENQPNDPSIVWPPPAVVAKLPEEWVVARKDEGGGKDGGVAAADVSGAPTRPSKEGRKRPPPSKKMRKKAGSSPREDAEENAEVTQPYYLNHVRGSTRLRHASQRVGAAAGSVVSTFVLCSLSTAVTPEDVGMAVPDAGVLPRDLAVGLAVGAIVVVFIFALELWMGWVRIVGYFETVVPAEKFWINFSWDVLFHAGVSVNEELMLRGWMFVLGCRGFLGGTFDWFEVPSTAAACAIAGSVVLQSTLFALLHLHSPGSTWVSLLNLFLGGIAASLNLMSTGGSLWLGIGWHFGWNIFMGHILGRSTSGIPMSCAVISVIPNPSELAAKYHGGTFGPEQGVLAPIAYVLGMIIVVYLYGWEGLESWRDRLVLEFSYPPA